MKRCIFHIDMDAFFASVEIAGNPSLKGKPVIIGGQPNQRGVVSTCSYEARTFGVRSAMSLTEAYKRCPHGIFLDGNYGLYKEYSSKIFDIFYSFTPFVEVVSIDEAYLDVSAHIKADEPKELADDIRENVFKETKLTCSVGIATNKLVAKVASSKAKPNGVFEVPPGDEASFLALLPIQCLPGVGEKTQIALNREDIQTVADLQAITIDKLIFRYGSSGYYFYYASRGQDNRAVDWESHPPKSIGAESTFDKDQNDVDVIVDELKMCLKKAHKRLLAHHMRSKRVSLKMRYQDFTTITRSHTLETHLNEYESLERIVVALFHQNYSEGDPPLRLIGASFEQLTDSYWQPLLF